MNKDASNLDDRLFNVNMMLKQCTEQSQSTSDKGLNQFAPSSTSSNVVRSPKTPVEKDCSEEESDDQLDDPIDDSASSRDLDNEGTTQAKFTDS